MKTLQLLLIFSSISIVCQGAPVDDRSAVSDKFEVEDYHMNENGEGTYSFNFDTSNGIHQQQTGQTIPTSSGGINNSENLDLIVRGSYSYVSPEGIHVTFNYIADKNGFRPERVHFHVPEAVGAPGFGEEEIVVLSHKITSSALASLLGSNLG